MYGRIQVHRHSRSGAASSISRARVYFTFGPYMIVGTPLAASFFPNPGSRSDVSLPSGTSVYRRWALADRCLPTSLVKWIVLWVPAEAAQMQLPHYQLQSPQHTVLHTVTCVCQRAKGVAIILPSANFAMSVDQFPAGTSLSSGLLTVK